MRRSIVLLSAVFLGYSTAVSAAVVERPSPSLNTAASPVPALSLTMSGPASASFTPVLTGAVAASLSAPAPSPSPSAIPAAPPAAVSPLRPVAAAARALAAAPTAAPARANRERGPPDARDAGYASFVAKTVAETVRSWAVPVEDILSGHDALLVGENHGSLTSVNVLTREMPRLAAAGVTAIGIEGLKRPQQGAVDDFLAGRRAEVPEEVLAFSPKRRAAFRALLDAARAHGVRVVAIISHKRDNVIRD